MSMTEMVKVYLYRPVGEWAAGTIQEFPQRTAQQIVNVGSGYIVKEEPKPKPKATKKRRAKKPTEELLQEQQFTGDEHDED